MVQLTPGISSICIIWGTPNGCGRNKLRRDWDGAAHFQIITKLSQIALKFRQPYYRISKTISIRRQIETKTNKI